MDFTPVTVVGCKGDLVVYPLVMFMFCKCVEHRIEVRGPDAIAVVEVPSAEWLSELIGPVVDTVCFPEPASEFIEYARLGFGLDWPEFG